MLRHRIAGHAHDVTLVTRPSSQPAKPWSTQERADQ
jgi:hypothetical protein